MKNKVILSLVILLVAGGLVFVLLHSREKSKTLGQLDTQTQTDSDFLRAQMKVCYGKDQSDNCYKQAADIFTNKWQYPKILQLLKDNEQYPEVFGRCHELTHYIGRQAYEQEQSVVKVYAQASPVCWGGFYHGVMEQYFLDKHLSLINPQAPAIAEALSVACGNAADYTTPRYYSECVHGIGHAMMFITNTDLNKSLLLCDQLGGLASTCYGGVFMENSSSSTNTAHPTKFLKASDPMYPCNSLAEKYLTVCYQYQSSYFGELSQWNWHKTALLCEQIPAQYQDGCFHIIGSNQVGTTQDYAVMRADCRSMPKPSEEVICLSGVMDGLSGRYVGQVSKLKDFCTSLETNLQQGCFSNLAGNIHGWSSDPSQFSQYCAQLENKTYIDWCMGGGNFSPNRQSFN